MNPQQQLATSRTRWLDSAVEATARDPRVVAVLLSGSLARGGGGDAWSDLDLILVPTWEALEEVRGDVTGRLALPGERLFVLEKPRNAPVGGAYQGALWDTGFSLPLWTDWYVCPPGLAVVPDDAVVLVERTEQLLRRVDSGFVEWLDAHRVPNPAPTPGGSPDRLLTVTVAAKYLARGDTIRLERMLHRLGLTPASSPVGVRDQLIQAADAVPEPALRDAVAAVVRLAHAAAR